MALDNGHALTPPMGWNPWNCFQGATDEKTARGIADAFVSSGMKDAGYTWVNLDDYWFPKQGHKRSSPSSREAAMPRDADGSMLVDPKKFPAGMQALGDYVKSKGLRFGMYLRPDEVLGTEARDLKQMTDWGMEFLKLDMPPDHLYWPFREVLLQVGKETGKPLLYSIHQDRADLDSFELANMWRTSGDIFPTWESVTGCFYTTVGREAYAGPGGWNDPDMLQIGNGRKKPEKGTPLGAAEDRSHMGLWCIAAAPLIVGTDVRKMTKEVRDVLCNKDAIAIDQDQLGIQGFIVKREGPGEVWAKPLQNGDVAVLLHNRGGETATVAITWKELGLADGVTAREAWSAKDLGKLDTGYACELAARDCHLLRLSGVQRLPQADKAVMDATLSHPSPWWGDLKERKTYERKGWASRIPTLGTDREGKPLAGAPAGAWSLHWSEKGRLANAAWRVDGGYARITGTLGVAAGVRWLRIDNGPSTPPADKPNTVRFQVLADARVLWTSEPLAEGASVPFDVAIAGKHTVALRAIRTAPGWDLKPVFAGVRLVAGR
jgi:alpha-galactosidase